MKTIIIKPIITEKSMDQVSLGKFTFEVGKEANKKSIKKAIEEKFKVHVVNLSTLTVKGKKIKAGRKRTEVARSSWKKAIIKLKTGEKIELFDIAQGQTGGSEQK